MSSNKTIFFVLFFIGCFCFVENSAKSVEGNCESLLKQHEQTRIDPEKYYSETGLWGLDEVQGSRLVSFFKEQLGQYLLGVYVIGSRVTGRKGFHKGYANTMGTEDIDVLIHLKEPEDSSAFGLIFQKLYNELSKPQTNMLPYAIVLHTTRTADNGAITAYNGGDIATYMIIDRNAPMNGRPDFTAIKLSQ